MKVIRAILLIVAAVYFLSFVFGISGFTYSGDGFSVQHDHGSSRFGSFLVSLFCGLGYLCLVGYSHLLARYGASPAMSATRKLIPVLFFGALTLFAGSYGIYYVVLCLRELFGASATAWRYFLVAELSLLFAWRFLVWTLISLAVYRGILRREQVRLKRGIVGRVMFLLATGVAGFCYVMAKSLFGMPWWFTHLGHAVIAVLMFCAFTYPWSRGHRMTPNTSLEPTPTAPPVLTKP
jgi:hypothetical protein